MIKFLQHSSSKYPPRTFENASADATIAFAFDFNTPGERLTKEAVRTQSKIYIPISVSSIRDKDELKIKTVASILADNKVRSLNIAGNQLATCYNFGYQQAQVDFTVHYFLSKVFSHPVFDPTYLSLIRSGGQSGFDEAGLKAAVELNISALCLCPLGWKFNDINGNVICDEHRFKNRFSRQEIIK